MENKGYAGKIKSQGSQFVQAPNGSAPSKKGTVKQTGNDLRSGTRDGK
jgi:hypothetical protein